MDFEELAQIPEPGRSELAAFVGCVVDFLQFVLKDSDQFASLWTDEPELRDLAVTVLEKDVPGSAKELTRAIWETPDEKLVSYGLTGNPLRFKLQVLGTISREFKTEYMESIPFSVRKWLRQAFEGMDAVLGSLVLATGAGGLIRQFKKALSAFAGKAAGEYHY